MAAEVSAVHARHASDRGQTVHRHRIIAALLIGILIHDGKNSITCSALWF